MMSSRSARAQDAPRPPRAAFIFIGSFSGTNASVLERLEREFPDLEVDCIDVRRWIRSRRILLVANLLAVLGERGPGVFLRRQRLWGAFFRTSLLFRLVRRLVRHQASHRGYGFTFQTQSLFDGSVPGIPHFVYTDHTELVNQRYPDFEPTAAAPPAWVTREREIYRHAHRVFTMSPHVRASVIEQYGVPPANVISVGAGSNVTIQPDAFRLPDYSSVTILFVGREWERKGGPDLLAAFRHVRMANPRASLSIVGCSPGVSGPGLTVYGELAPDQVAEHYERACVFCMPTLREPFGIVFVEALAHGLPVVATDVGAVPHIVRHGEFGYLHAPHDVEGMAASLELLLGDPPRCRRMGLAGMEFVQRRYTWSRTMSQISSEIRSALESPVAPRPAPVGGHRAALAFSRARSSARL